MNFKVGDIVMNIKSGKLYKVSNVRTHTLDCRRVKGAEVAKRGSNWKVYEFRKLSPLEKAMK